MNYYPIGLLVDGRRCLVVGGGRVAERKARGLIECGAKVTVVSPELTPGLVALQSDGLITWEPRGYLPGDAKDFFLVMAATDDPAVQNQVQFDAVHYNILLNVADVPEKCNFILPALLRRGALTVAVSTSGKSPALAKKLRHEIEAWLGPQYEIAIEVLGLLRPYVLAWQLPQPENEKIFQGLIDQGIVEVASQGDLPVLLSFLEQKLARVVPPELVRQLKKLMP